MRQLGLVAGMALITGCMATPAAPPPSPRTAIGSTLPVEVQPPVRTGAEILAAQPFEVREAIKQHPSSGSWPTYRTAGYVLYPYEAGPQPIVDCAALRTTDVQLQPDETITDLALATRNAGWRPRRLRAIRVIRCRMWRSSRSWRASRPT